MKNGYYTPGAPSFTISAIVVPFHIIGGLAYTLLPRFIKPAGGVRREDSWISILDISDLHYIACTILRSVYMY